MSVVQSINAMSFPKQGDRLGKRTTVCFHFNTSQTVGGVFVRDDAESPGVSIIKLDDGRYVLTTECHYSMPVQA